MRQEARKHMSAVKVPGGYPSDLLQDQVFKRTAVIFFFFSLQLPDTMVALGHSLPQNMSCFPPLGSARSLTHEFQGAITLDYPP